MRRSATHFLLTPSGGPGLHRRFGGRLVAAVVAVGTAVLCSGCTQFQDHRASLASLHASGRYEQAAAILDDPETRKSYGERNEVLWHLDRGAIALAMGESDLVITHLERAEQIAEVERERSAGDILAQWTLNDTAAKYIAQPYEDIYINVLKLLAQLQAGRLDGYATVEARRLSSKADFLRDLYLKYEAALERESPAGVPSAAYSAVPSSGRAGSAQGTPGAHGGLTAVNPGQFIESPLGTFLTAVTFMKTGDREFQRVAARRLLDSIRLQRGLIGAVRVEDFEGLEELPPDAVNLLIVALSGRGPTKYAQRVGPIPIGTVPVYFELPYLQVHPSEIVGAYVEVEGFVSAGSSVYREPLKLVEDLSLVAAENHRRMLPLIHRRTLLRYAMKATASVIATEMARKQASDRDQGAVQVAGVLLGLIAITATERADLRSWVFLPGQARVGLLKLPAGEHRVRVVFQSRMGSVTDATEWQPIYVTADGLTSIVAHHWR